MRKGQEDSLIILTWCVILSFCLAVWVGLYSLLKYIIGVVT